MNSRQVALLLAVLVAGCSGEDRERTPTDEGFDPIGAIERGDDWLTAYSADSSLLFRMPPHYRQYSDEYPCRIPLSFTGTVCIAPATSRRETLRTLESSTDQTDGWLLTAFITDTVRSDRGVMEIERGRFAGGIGGQSNVRRMLVHVPSGEGGWVVVAGAVASDAGFDDVLAIARSIIDHP
jgi:hypothetical protein